MSLIKNYFVCTNAAQGFINLIESNIQDLDKIYILKSSTTTIKSNILSQIALFFNKKNHSIELLNSCLNNLAFDGVIIPNLRIGIIDENILKNINLEQLNISVESVDLREITNNAKLKIHKDFICKLDKEIALHYSKTYELFLEAKKIHDDWENIYLKNMDFSEANKMSDEIIELFFSDKSLGKKSIIKRRFFGGATPTGARDFIPNITSNTTKRYLIKGRPGTGKSTILKKIAKVAESKGFDCEIYHCGFDVDSLDMILFPELDIVIFDSTAPHEYFPEREHDEIIDVYERCVTAGTDTTFKAELESIVSQYNNSVSIGVDSLNKAQQLQDNIESLYIDNINCITLNQITSSLLDKLEES